LVLRSVARSGVCNTGEKQSGFEIEGKKVNWLANKSLPMLAIVAVLVALLCMAVALVTGKPSTAITVHNLRATRLEDGVSVGLKIANHSPNVLGVVPIRLEIFEGAEWRDSRGIYGFSQSGDLGPHASASSFCFINRFPPGSHLRLVMQSQRARKGLDSFIVRLKLRLLKGDERWSLNPFDRKVTFYTDPTEFTTQEFAEP
jgi:hypothetical protein